MLESIKAFFLSVPVMVLMVLGIGAAIFAVVFAVRTYYASSGMKDRKSGYTQKRLRKEAIMTLLLAVLAIGCLLLAGCNANIGKDADVSTGDGSQQDPAPQVPVVEPLPDVNLTEAQLQAFLADYDLTFDDSSLTYGTNWTPGAESMVQQRIAAYKAAGSSMTDGIAMPYLKALEDIKNLKGLSAEEKDALYKEWRKQLYQDIIADPVIGIAWLEMLSENDLIMENNSYWIQPNLEIIDSLFNGTYKQPKAGDAGYAEKMLIELNNLPEPTDTTCRGLDYLLVFNGTKIEVRQSYARLAARVCFVLDYFDIQGVTYRKSSSNWHLLPIAEDSMVRATKNTEYQESEVAILLVYAGKDGKEAITYGSNLIDRRPEEFKTNEPEPPTTTTNDTTPPDTTTPDTPPTTTPKTQYGTLRINYIDEQGVSVATTYTKTVEVGKTWSSVKSPVVPGYALRDQSQSTISSNKYGKMTTLGITVDVVYVKQVQTATIVVQYLDADTGAKIFDTETYTNYKIGDSYKFSYKPKTNYWVDTETFSGTLKSSDLKNGVLMLTFYYHYLPLEAWKDKTKDPVNNNNADVGGGENLPTDGTGVEQPKEPPRTDYNSTGDTTNRSDYDPNTGNSTTTLTPNDKHESSGGGGLDHEIKDANGGMTDNGNPPERDPIDVTTSTTVTDTNPSQSVTDSSSSTSSSSGTTSNTHDEPVNTGAIGEPD